MTAAATTRRRPITVVPWRWLAAGVSAWAAADVAYQMAVAAAARAAEQYLQIKEDYDTSFPELVGEPPRRRAAGQGPELAGQVGLVEVARASGNVSPVDRCSDVERQHAATARLEVADHHHRGQIPIGVRHHDRSHRAGPGGGGDGQHHLADVTGLAQVPERLRRPPYVPARHRQRPLALITART